MKTRITIRLFVSGSSRASVRAVENLKALCADDAVTRSHDIDLDIIDINESPQIAEEEKILVTPTLLKKQPLPVRRVVGDLSNPIDVFATLDIDSRSLAASEAGSGNT